MRGVPQKGKGKAQSVEVNFAPGALADFREGSDKPYGDTDEDALAAEMDMTTGLLEGFIAHSAAWEALEVWLPLVMVCLHPSWRTL